MPAAAKTQKQPVRMAKFFSQMLTDCPQDIRVYGACVADIQGGVNRLACDKEFQKLRACFQRVAGKRAGRA